MREAAASLFASLLLVGCFNPTGSVFASMTGSTAEVNVTTLDSSTGTGSDVDTGTSGSGMLSTTSTTVEETSSSMTGSACGDGVIQDGEECDGQEGCQDCVKTFRRVFVTSEVYPGNLGGLAGADQKCQAAADAAGLPGRYMAWLSSSEGSPAERFVRSTVPYRQVDGSEIASGWDDLVDGMIAGGIYLTEHKLLAEKGQTPSCQADAAFAWTGTRYDGTFAFAESQCSDWGDVPGVGYTGKVGDLGLTWSESCLVECQDTANLYCFEQ